MSKTFAGTVSFDFKLVLSDESTEDVMQNIQSAVETQRTLSAFQQFIVSCNDTDARIVAMWKKSMRDQLKGCLQEVHTDTKNAGRGDSFTFSPISVQVKGKV